MPKLFNRKFSIKNPFNRQKSKAISLNDNDRVISLLLREKKKKIIYTILFFFFTMAAYGLFFIYKEERRSCNSQYFLSAQAYLEEGKVNESIQILKFLINNKSEEPYYTYSKLVLASLLKQSNNNAEKNEALFLYQNVLKNKNLDSFLLDLINLNQISTYFSSSFYNGDGRKKNTSFLLKDINSLIEKESSVYPYAIELKGIILYTMGRYKEAMETFSKLITDTNIKEKSERIPEGVKFRSSIMHQILFDKISKISNDTDKSIK